MALNLKKLAARRPGDNTAEERSRQAPSPQSPPSNPDWHGRPTPPPPPGSSWDDFVEWASEGAFDPWPDDVALAWKLWTRRGETEAQQASPKGP